MNRICSLLVALVVAGAALPAGVSVALADPATPTPSATQTVAQLNDELTADQTKLNDLNDQVERAQADLDGLDRKLAADKQAESSMDKDLTALGRLEYEQPAFSLSNILDARSLAQLLADVAQARLIANKQRSLLVRARELKRQDQDARNQVSSRLAQVQLARDEAATLATRAQALLGAAQDAAARARASALAAQARATQGVPVPGPKPPAGAWPNRFAFGYCTWYVATRRYIPWLGNAIEWWPNARAYGYPEGQTPTVGSILVTRESGYGHVAYVESVSGNSFTVSEMNYTAWDVVDRRTITLGGPVPIVGFIYGQ